MNTAKLIIRILFSPFLFLSMVLLDITISAYRTFLFVKNGGEVIAYKSAEKETIHDIYLKLKEWKEST
jgi:hypothetical protein